MPPVTNTMQIIIALTVAAAVTALGVWAYMAYIHGQETWLALVLAISMPIATLTGLWGFFDSALVYWASLIAGFLLWFWIGYAVADAAAWRDTLK